MPVEIHDTLYSNRKPGVHLEGFEEIERMLKQLPEKVRGDRVIGQALGAAMRPAVKAAKGKCPRKTGALRKSLIQKLMKQRRRSQLFSGQEGSYRVVTMGPRREAKNENGEWCAKYGMVVEFGWSDTGISPSRTTAKVGWRKRARGSESRPATPYMRPALYAQQAHVLNNMAKSIGKKIEKEAAKLMKKKAA